MDWKKFLSRFWAPEKGADNTFAKKATQCKHPHKMRGVGYTRKNKEQSKKRRKMARASRRINRPR